MSPSRIEFAADYLLKVRRDGGKITDLPITCRPQSLVEAYAIQRSLLRKLDTEPAGWFVALTNADMQKVHGATMPIYGRILRSNVLSSPGKVPLSSATRSATVEAEFAFRMACDLPPRAIPYSEAEVSNAIKSVIPILEFVDSLYESLTAVDVTSLVADNGADGFIVLGKETEEPAFCELLEHPVRLTINDRFVDDGAMGNPIRDLAWLCNDLMLGGSHLRAGEIIGTGNCLGSYSFGKAGDVVNADFGRLGSVTAVLGS
ncbi:2-keto-4-pentenoate hydratase [Rhodoligotrophos appendicifer]|uniref:2-keto-4-pentenoate hydratase n=1 Tax=Rhodoligotrophos appendicifer TaxID=987056 RepID=UPI001184D711|nr:fumarylacetoacetate hydrolase family protein [Rhodoligotrophos appendicifer]